LVATGGAIGASVRFSISWVLREVTHQLPWSAYAATTSVNVLGCFAIGWILTGGSLGTNSAEATRVFAVVGFLGGFTTFSAFGYESLLLLQEDGPSTAALYVMLQIVLGLGAVYLGSRLA